MTIQLTRRSVAIVVAAFLTLTAVTATTLVLTLTSRAEANHRFDDIADGTFFHDSTAWLKDNGIADGFNDGTFRKDDPITRGQASYWFANYNDALEIRRTISTTSNSSTSALRIATCPSGTRPVAGGFQGPGEPWTVKTSGPDTGFFNRWKVEWESPSPAVFGTGEVWALCAPDTTPE